MKENQNTDFDDNIQNDIAEEKINHQQKEKHNHKRKIWIPKLLPFIVLVVIVLAFLVLKNNFPAKTNKAEIITESELYKIVNKSELSTYQCVYNDICTVNDKDKKLYHCAYEARVNAGIDFSKVNIKIAKEEDANWVVNVTIPKVSITDINVDISSLDYIWEDSSANTDTVSAQAYKACINDVTEKTKSETKIYDLAQENAENMIEALIKPFIEEVNSPVAEYNLKISSEGENKK